MPVIRNISFSALMLFLLVTDQTFAGERGLTNTSSSRNVKLRSIDIDAVRWTDGFWAEKFAQCHKVMIPHMWGVLSDPHTSHVWQNFRIAAGLQEGEFKGTWWEDGDFYKWLEAVACVYAVTGDQDLDELMDSIIEVIGKAQEEDGYLHTSISIGRGIRRYRPWISNMHFAGKTERFQTLRDHELYNMGHLMTVGCIHHRATGKNTLLNISLKTADFLYETFKTREPRLAHFGFNPSYIMGAVELYRTTGEEKYLELAKIFIDMRGSAADGTDENQTRTPLREETEAVGHYVTGPYLWAGAADVYAENGDKELLQAIKTIWQNAASKKAYLTGGAGAIHHGVSSAGDKVSQSYGREYQLPNANAYNETCAPISDLIWTWRMLGLTGEARYADRVERILYNSALSGISLDGKLYRRTQPLAHYGEAEGTIPQTDDNPTLTHYLVSFCCPTQVIRIIAQAHAMAYSISSNGVYVNLYGSNVLNTELPDSTTIRLRQETDYPWDGTVKVTVEEPKSASFEIMLRLPGWAKGARVSVNGNPVEVTAIPGTYTQVKRNWSSGDVIELSLPMQTQLMEANPLVEETRNQIAVQRGPLVYCLESLDLLNGLKITDVMIPADIKLVPRRKSYLLDGVTVLEGEAVVLSEDKEDWTDSEGVAPPGKGKTVQSRQLYQRLGTYTRVTHNIRLIPYYAWGNRGVTDMAVWMPVDY